MISKEVYAVLALYTYDATSINKPAMPPGWTEVRPQPVGTGGFQYAVFQNLTTNEVVIAFRGTDNDFGDWTTNLGMTSGQERQAAEVYVRVLRELGTPDGSNITFTGHSLGGGLAATMAVWFNRSATVFDPSPTQLGATTQTWVDGIVTSLGVSAPQSIKDYAANVIPAFSAREGLVAFR